MRAKPSVLLAVAVAACACAPRAHAQFVIFQGDASAEAAWRAAAGGSVPLETFEGFFGVPSPFSGPSDQVVMLPELRIRFESDVPGAYPGVYANASQAHSGVNQIANFGGGLGNGADYRIFPLPAPGRPDPAIVALGFWQCDPQGDQPMHAYAADGTLVGTIVGLINDGSGHSFAGFVSSTPIARVEVPGNLGDGWDHYDDLQVLVVDRCPADFNGDGTVNSQDFFDFLAAFFAGDPAADFNHDSAVNSQDFFDFLAVFFAGC